MFTQVLSYALQGCGTSLTKLKASPEYRSLLAQARSLPMRVSQDKEKELILRKGTRSWGMHLSTSEKVNWGLLQRKPDEEYRPEERALIAAFSAELFASAKAALPRKARQLAKQWKSARLKGRVKIAEDFLALFPDTSGNSFTDELTQTPEKVLPGRFKLRTKEDALRPNCIGRTVLAAAFFELCGAEVYSNLVITTACRGYDQTRVKLVADILGLLRQPGVYSSRTFYAKLRRTKLRAEDRLAHPQWAHGSIYVRVSAERYLLFDPTHGKVTVFSFSAESHAMRHNLTKHGDVSPGATLLFQNNTIRRYKGRVQRHLRRTRRELKRFNERIDHGSSDIESVYDLLYRSELSYLLAAGLGWKDQSIMVDPACRYFMAKVSNCKRYVKAETRSQMACAILTTVLAKHTSWLKDHGLKKLERRLSKEELCSLSAKYSREIIRRIPSYAVLGLLHVSERIWEMDKEFTLHIYSELGNARWQLACAVLGHVAVTTDNWQETEAVLARHCFSQYRLFHHALVLRDRYCADALYSAECLKRKIGLIECAQRVLPRLARRHGLNLWKGGTRGKKQERRRNAQNT